LEKDQSKKNNQKVLRDKFGFSDDEEEFDEEEENKFKSKKVVS
jgi:hypothetical protein